MSYQNFVQVTIINKSDQDLAFKNGQHQRGKFYTNCTSQRRSYTT